LEKTFQFLPFCRLKLIFLNISIVLVKALFLLPLNEFQNLPFTFGTVIEFSSLAQAAGKDKI
jgi:hypothetical protein